MKSGKPVTLIVLLLAVSFSGGCSVEQDLRDGLSDGVSAALSAIIQAPVNHALDQTFSEP